MLIWRRARLLIHHIGLLPIKHESAAADLEGLTNRLGFNPICYGKKEKKRTEESSGLVALVPLVLLVLLLMGKEGDTNKCCMEREKEREFDIKGEGEVRIKDDDGM